MQENWEKRRKVRYTLNPILSVSRLQPRCEEEGRVAHSRLRRIRKESWEVPDSQPLDSGRQLYVVYDSFFLCVSASKTETFIFSPGNSLLPSGFS